MGRHEDVISCCDEALRIDPKYAPAWYMKAMTFRDLDRESDADHCFTKARELGYESEDYGYGT